MLKNLLGFVREESGRVLRRPRRLRHLFNPRKWPYIKYRLGISEEWQPAGGGGFRGRKYESYEQYVEHQRSKLPQIDLTEYDRKYREILRERIRATGRLAPGSSVLCLAARLGTEVKAFIDLGCFAVGTDLNPGAENHYVLHGDFHELQYADASIDAVFTNSLDHAHDIDRVADEVARVLKPGGHLILDLVAATDRGKEPGFWASCWWERADDVVALFEKRGLEVVHRETIEKPWEGEHIWLRRPPASA